MFLKNFAKVTGNYLCQSHFFNNVSGLRAATLLKKRPWQRCFLVHFAKFLRTAFFTEYPEVTACKQDRWQYLEQEYYNNKALSIWIHGVLRKNCPYLELSWSAFFTHSDWTRRDTEYLSVFSPNAGKCGKNEDQNNSKYGLFLRMP